jgi:hypothetical protein
MGICKGYLHIPFSKGAGRKGRKILFCRMLADFDGEHGKDLLRFLYRSQTARCS